MEFLAYPNLPKKYFPSSSSSPSLHHTNQSLPTNSKKARAGLALALSLLLPPSPHIQTFLSSGPLRPFPFEPLPSSLSIASDLLRTKIADARKESDRRTKESEELGKKLLWRDRWRMGVRKGVKGFRGNVCKLTGLLCEKKEV